MIKKFIHLIIVILVFVDFGYSFYQYYNSPLFGDMADVIMPTKDYGYFKVLTDPLGLEVLINDAVYPNPNRFFVHYITSKYFLSVPIFLQNFTNPINSVYLSSAIIKLLTQIFIVYLLAKYISKTKKIFSLNFILAIALVVPFFQYNGYNRYMGIVDKSAIYTFFYALSLAFLLYFYYPFYENIYNNKKIKFSFVQHIFYILFVVFLSFNGPLITGIALIINSIILLYMFINNYNQISGNYSFFTKLMISFKKINKYYVLYFIFFNILSLYSLYISKNNLLNDNHIDIVERYQRLPIGIYYLLTQKLGNILLISIIIINYIIIKIQKPYLSSTKILSIIKWSFIFSFIYIMLIPLGGYREYRSNILRYDTIMPITIISIYLFGVSSHYLITKSQIKFKKLYYLYIVFILGIYTNADTFNKDMYICEKEALIKISQSTDKIVKLNNNCAIMDWQIIYDYKLSERNAKLFKYWNITNDLKLYYKEK